METNKNNPAFSNPKTGTEVYLKHTKDGKPYLLLVKREFIWLHEPKPKYKNALSELYQDNTDLY